MSRYYEFYAEIFNAEENKWKSVNPYLWSEEKNCLTFAPILDGQSMVSELYSFINEHGCPARIDDAGGFSVEIEKIIRRANQYSEISIMSYEILEKFLADGRDDTMVWASYDDIRRFELQEPSMDYIPTAEENDKTARLYTYNDPNGVRYWGLNLQAHVNSIISMYYGINWKYFEGAPVRIIATLDYQR